MREFLIVIGSPKLKVLVATFALLAGIAWTLEAQAQCRWIHHGSGYVCQCPDGSLASMVGGRIVCPSICPAGTAICGSICCNDGSYCSRYGCTPHGAVDCGTGYCSPGTKCGSGNKCLNEDDIDCGGGRSCSAGNKGALGGGCVPEDKVDCSGYHCDQDKKCGKGWRGCVPADAVDCGPVMAMVTVPLAAFARKTISASPKPKQIAGPRLREGKRKRRSGKPRR